jgi:predicted XRE-type DNA-binding protein
MGRRREAAEVARDRRKIADLYFQGWLQAEIAEEVGVHQSTVSRDLKALQAEWLQSALVDFNKAKARELARIDRLEREYWRAWLRSVEDKEVEVQEKVEAGDKQGRLKVSLRREGQAGDPRFLAGVQWCIEQRCQILRLYAPVDVDIKSGGRPIFQKVEIVQPEAVDLADMDIEDGEEGGAV